MPGTGDTSVDDLSFPERTVLVLTHIGDCGNLAVVPEYRDSLPSAGHHTRTSFWNCPDSTNSDVSVRLRNAPHVVPPLHDSTHDVQCRHDGQSDAQNYG